LASNPRRVVPLPEVEVDKIVESIVGRDRRKRIGRIEAIGTPDEQCEHLAVLLELPSVGLTVEKVSTFGEGGRAAVEILLSNGETMVFESVREMTRPAILAAELAACAGVAPKINGQRALQAAVAVKGLAVRQQAFSDNDIAVDWAATYLQAADVLDVDINDQSARWAAFSHLEQADPLARSKVEGTGVAAASIVLRHTDGERLVRAGWFYQHVRSLDAGVGQSALTVRMLRVGWQRRGRSGRVKATCPSRPAVLGWNFWTVPSDWEEDR
jgi:hypothetical protein